jgi:hypothetical protein
MRRPPGRDRHRIEASIAESVRSTAWFRKSWGSRIVQAVTDGVVAAKVAQGGE